MNNSSTRIVLFALTGIGNAVLSALCAADMKPRFLVTRKESGPFPYYDEQPLFALAQELGVPCLTDRKGEEHAATEGANILLCATYHRILPPELWQKVPWAVNLHPSLLPRYRGPNPFHWVIRNNEPLTGVTAHLITGIADAGPMIWSESVTIAPDETQGSLRRKLGLVAGRGAVATLRAVRANTIECVAQDESLATTFGRPTATDRILRADWTVAQACRWIRSFSPFPGVVIGPHVACGVVGSAPASLGAPGTIVSIEGGACRLRLVDGDIIVRLKAAPHS